MTERESRAKKLHAAGYHLVPMRRKTHTVDGEWRPKWPFSPWEVYQARQMLQAEIAFAFGLKDCDIAIVPGSSGVVVLDFDTKVQADIFNCWLAQIPKELKNRLGWVKTPTGGMHVYYGAPNKEPRSGDLAYLPPLPGHTQARKTIEIKCERRLAMAPGESEYGHYRTLRLQGQTLVVSPDILPRFEQLTVEEEQVLFDAARALNEYAKPIANHDDFEIDEPHEERIADPYFPPIEERIELARHWLAEAPPTIQGEGGSVEMLKAVRTTIFDFALSPEDAEPLLEEYGDRGIPPWRSSEIRHKIEDVMSTPSRSVGSLLPAFNADAEVAKIIKPAGTWIIHTKVDMESLAPAPLEANASTVPIKKDRDAWRAYLWEGQHRRLDERDRERRIRSIERVKELIPAEGFFAEYIKYLLPLSDTPVCYHLASALGLAGHLLNRRVALEAGGQALHPNLWISVIGRSSSLHKSTSINYAKAFLDDDLDYRGTVMSENFTGEALLAQMGWQLPSDEDSPGKHSHVEEARTQCEEAYEDAIREGRHFTHGLGLIHANELGHMLKNLNKNFNQGAREMLTTLYDSPPLYTKVTRTQGISFLWRPCLSIMAATTPDWLSENLSQGDVEGGFLPRWLFFPATLKDYILPLREQVDAQQKERVIKTINRLKSVRGIVRLAPDAEDYYADWRVRVEKNADQHVNSWVNRLGETAHKIAMIYEATTCPEPILTTLSLKSVTLATTVIDWLLRELTTLIKDELAFTPDQKKLMQTRKHIKAAGADGIPTKSLLQKMGMRSQELKALLDTLIDRGEVRQLPSPRGQRYQWLGDEGTAQG